MPEPDSLISIRIILRPAQSTRTAERQFFEQLRGPGVGGFQPLGDTGSGFGHRETNSFGNLETIPPYVWSYRGLALVCWVKCRFEYRTSLVRQKVPSYRSS